MEPYLEHLNITVTNVENTIKFLQTAMPELKIRGGGEGIKTLEWVHLGTEKSYISIEDRGAREKGPHIPYKHPGLNHIGFVVANIEDLAKRMRQAELGIESLQKMVDTLIVIPNQNLFMSNLLLYEKQELKPAARCCESRKFVCNQKGF